MEVLDIMAAYSAAAVPELDIVADLEKERLLGLMRSLCILVKKNRFKNKRIDSNYKQLKEMECKKIKYVLGWSLDYGVKNNLNGNGSTAIRSSCHLDSSKNG